METIHVTDQRGLRNALEIRKRFFVEEQRVSEEMEHDQYDEIAEHILVYDGKVPVATGRMRVIDQNIGKFERICVQKQFRKLHFGKAVIKELEQASRKKGFKR